MATHWDSIGRVVRDWIMPLIMKRRKRAAEKDLAAGNNSNSGSSDFKLTIIHQVNDLLAAWGLQTFSPHVQAAVEMFTPYALASLTSLLTISGFIVATVHQFIKGTQIIEEAMAHFVCTVSKSAR